MWQKQDFFPFNVVINIDGVLCLIKMFIYFTRTFICIWVLCLEIDIHIVILRISETKLFEFSSQQSCKVKTNI